MVRFLRRLRGECRKSGFIVVVLGPFAIAALAVAMKRTHSHNAQLVRTSTITGSIQVAADQHATLLGWVLVSTFVACGTAVELGNGAWENSLAAAGSVRRLLLAKAAVAPLLVLFSEFVTVIVLRVASALVPDWSAGRETPHIATCIGSVIRALVVAEWIGFAACFSAVLSGSSLLAAVAAPALLTLPNAWTWTTVSWMTPGRWMTELMRPSVFGEGADYFGNAAGPADHSYVALVLLAVTGVLLALTVAWRCERPFERRTAGS